MQGLIYMITIKITDGTFAKYIGQTIQEFTKRKQRHIYNMKDPSKNTPLYDTMRRYGLEACVFKIIESNIQSIDVLNTRECYWIREHNTLFSKETNRYGLNYKDGGNSNGQWTQDLREKQSQILKDYYTNEEARELNRQRQIEVYNGNEELIQRHREIRQGYIDSEGGQKWRSQHSQFMTDRANSESGRQVAQKHSEFMKEYYNTPEGQQRRIEHGKRQREWLQSPEGIAWKKKISKDATNRMAERRKLIPIRRCTICQYIPKNNSNPKLTRHNQSFTHIQNCNKFKKEFMDDMPNALKYATVKAFFI